MTVVDLNTFRQHREESCSFHNEFRALVGRSKPTSFHLAVKRWQDEYAAKGISVIIITQNVDDLFEKADLKDVIHVHGDIRYMQCLAYNHRWFVGYNAQDVNQSCGTGCGCKVCKPGVVFFNEHAPAYEQTLKLLATMGRRDLFVVLGTSCQVFPLAEVLENGRVRKVYSSLDKPQNDSNVKCRMAQFDHIVLGPCTDTLHEIRKLADDFDEQLRNYPPVEEHVVRNKRSVRKERM